MAELRFRVGAIFPAGNPTARYVMAVSIVLGDIRTVTELAGRDGQPRHERLYFVRLLEHHVREGLRLALVAHRERDDVRRFVSILPEEAQSAREELERLDPFTGPTGEPEDDGGPLQVAMDRVAAIESCYRIDGVRKRADFADLVAATTLLAEQSRRVLPPLVTFLEHAEAAWLRPWRG